MIQKDEEIVINVGVVVCAQENEAKKSSEKGEFAEIRLQGRRLGRSNYFRRRRSSLLVDKEIINNVPEGYQFSVKFERKLRPSPTWPKTRPTIPTFKSINVITL